MAKKLTKTASVATDSGSTLLRHLTGEYLHLADAMRPDDVLYWAATNGKTSFVADDLLKLVDEPRKQQAQRSIEQLLESGKLVADSQRPERLKLA